MARKSAAGSGTIRKKPVIRNGKEYIYWEARYTAGYDPGTGKQIQRSITGKTQKEVSRKLKEATTALDAGTYNAPNKMTVAEWMDLWSADYLGGVKPLTVSTYQSSIKMHIKPCLGAIRLDALTPHKIQEFYNSLTVSPKTVKNIHGVLHKALDQAVANRYIRFNPADSCVLPRVVRKEIKPLESDQIAAFLQAVRGDPFEDLFLVTLFTGLREGEILGLTWDCVDLDNGILTINKQLIAARGTKEKYQLAPTKNSKARTITVAPSVRDILRRVKCHQLENRLKYGECWTDTGFVFTTELGEHLIHYTVYSHYKRIAAQIGCPDSRFHDLRHTYAVASIQSGDDLKTVQENLGHATASFTLDVYGHVTQQMRQASADRMEQFIQSVKSKEKIS